MVQSEATRLTRHALKYGAVCVRDGLGVAVQPAKQHLRNGFEGLGADLAFQRL